MTAHRGERGAAAVLTLAVALLSAALALGVCAIATYLLVAAVRAQAAADAAALAAAGATRLGPWPGSPRAAALEAAERHGAALLSCCGDTESLPPHVRVRVAVPVDGVGGALGRRAVAAAGAGLRPSEDDGESSGFAAKVPSTEGDGAAPRSRR